MDDIDLFIIQKLLKNSRISYRELANMSNMSVSATHKRIKKLEDDGIISCFYARPSIIALKCLWILIFGTSTAKSLDTVSLEIGHHECTRFFGITGGKFLYITAYLRDISELQEYSSFVSKTAQISEPTVGIINVPYKLTPEQLTTIDYKILKTLNRDARKPLYEIADDLGISAKTVRKRLDRMIDNNLVTFSIEWMPIYENSFINVFHISLNEGTDLISTFQKISDKYSKNVAYSFIFSNIPNFFTLHTWAKSAIDSHRIQAELEKEGFKNIIPHVFLSASWFNCWADHLLRA